MRGGCRPGGVGAQARCGGGHVRRLPLGRLRVAAADVAALRAAGEKLDALLKLSDDDDDAAIDDFKQLRRAGTRKS